MASDRRIRDFRCFTFKGCMRRKPFWFWLLPYFLTCCVLGALLALTFIAADSSAALSIFLLIVFFAGLVGTVIACYAIFFQRLHDIGLSGWWAIAMMVFGVICAVVDSVFDTGVFSALDSIVNLIFLLALGILPSQPEENKYGPNSEANGVFLYQPKAPAPADEVAITH